METPRRILVVDDEVGIREGCRRALAAAGYEVAVAENGPAALRQLREAPAAGRFDAVLVDAMLPGMGGLELLQQARQLDPELVCVVITGYAMVELAVQAMREGADDFVAKPFAPEHLLQVVRRELERRELRRTARRVAALEAEARELQRARAELAKLEAVQSRFMLKLVHTLRAPLALVQTTLDVIVQGYIPADEQPALLAQLAERSAAGLAALDDLLALAYLKEGVGLSRRERVRLADALADAAAGVAPLAERQGVALGQEVRGEPTVWANRDHVRALWAQLLANAVRYTRPGGAVTARAWLDEPAGRAVGEVRDTGIGIAAAELPRVFEELYRGEAAQALQPLGTGLGLAIVQQTVSLYAGGVEVESEPGRGSMFRFWLPAAAALSERSA